MAVLLMGNDHNLLEVRGKQHSCRHGSRFEMTAAKDQHGGYYCFSTKNGIARDPLLNGIKSEGRNYKKGKTALRGVRRRGRWSAAPGQGGNTVHSSREGKGTSSDGRG